MAYESTSSQSAGNFPPKNAFWSTSLRARPARGAARSLASVTIQRPCFYRKLREIIAGHNALEAPLEGEIEVDESYFDGHRKGKRGRGAAGKVTVFGLLKLGVHLHAVMTPDAGNRTLISVDVPPFFVSTQKESSRFLWLEDDGMTRVLGTWLREVNSVSLRHSGTVRNFVCEAMPTLLIRQWRGRSGHRREWRTVPLPWTIPLGA